jgi:predicted dehydrogenase
MKSGKLRIGLVGAGGIAHYAHIPGWKKIADAELVAVADIDRARAESTANQHGIAHVFTDFNDLVKLDLDAVDVCTPNRAHAPVTIAALNAGRHVLCEKPLATTTADVRKMGELADKKGLILMTAQHQRFGAAAQAIKRWTDAGNLGEVYHARVRAMRRAFLPTAAGFIAWELSGGGPCMDIGVHALDTCLWLMNFPTPTRATGAAKVNFAKGAIIPGAWGEWDRSLFSVEDFAAGFIHFENGMTMVLEAAWLGHQQEGEDVSCQIFGIKGGVKWPSAEFATVQAGSYVHGTLTNPKNIPSAHSEEIVAFHDAVVNGKPSPVPWTETIKVIGILEAIYASQRDGREVEVNAERGG